MGMKLCLEMLELPCVSATCATLLSGLRVPPSSTHADTQQGCVCMCVSVRISHKSAALYRGNI